jgi:hypothetical protein
VCLLGDSGTAVRRTAFFSSIDTGYAKPFGTRDGDRSVVAEQRPGWRVMDSITVKDASGPNFEVSAGSGAFGITLLVVQRKRINAEWRWCSSKPTRK